MRGSPSSGSSSPTSTEPENVSAVGEGPAESEPMVASAEAKARDFLRGAALEDRVLLDVRDELYAGDWGELEQDLRARLLGKPHIFRLMSKIEEDLRRLETLRSFEEANRVDLGAVRRRWEAERERTEGSLSSGAPGARGAARAEAGAGGDERPDDGEEHEAGVAGSGGPTR